MADYQPKRSKKQIDYLYGNARIDLTDGSVRSGKTWETCEKFVLKILETYNENVDRCIFGKTQETIERNVITTLRKQLDPLGKNPDAVRTTKGGVYILGKKVFMQGCNDKNATQKIKGMTLKHSLIDEFSLLTKEHFDMIRTRHITYEDYWIGGTTNPDAPTHWFYQEYNHLIGDGIQFDPEMNMSLTHFVLEDNLYIPKSELEAIKRSYHGVFYDRNILGRWVSAEGLVCPSYNPNFHKIPFDDIKQMIMDGKFVRYLGAADFGYPSPSSVGVYGVTSKNEFYKIFELYRGDLFTSHIIDWLRDKEGLLSQLANRPVRLELIFCDGASQDRIGEMKQSGLPVLNAKKDREPRLAFIDECFSTDKFFISDLCIKSDEELQSCQFLKPDESGYRENGAMATKPDHSIDEMSYCLYTSKLTYGF